MGQTATDKLISPIVGKAVTTEFDLDARIDTLEAGVPANEVTYTPANGAHWVNPDPTLVSGALDDIAGRVTTLEAGVPASEVTYTPADTNDWPGADPTLVSGALDTAADRVTLLETFRARARLVTVSASAEAAEAITLTITATDGAGAAVSGERVRVYISTDPEGTSAVNAAAFVVADAGDGSIEDDDTGNAIWICLLGGIGASTVNLSVTDQAASGSTLYVWVDMLGDGVTPIMSARVRTSITFAA